MNLVAPLIGTPLTQYDSLASTAQPHALGTEHRDGFGRTYRLAKVGASTLVVGNVLQGPAQVTTHQTMTPSAAAIGATAVTATLGATNATTADQYAGGFLVVDTTPGNGYAYVIASHPAAAASAACVFTLAEPVKVALTTSSRVSLCANPYNGVIQSPVTTLTGVPVGVAIFAALTGEFCWIQTKGVAAVLTTGTPAVGTAVGVPGTAAGSTTADTALVSGFGAIGNLLHVGADTLNKPTLINFP